MANLEKIPSVETATESDRALVNPLMSVLDTLRPIFLSEGGDVQLNSVHDGIARIEFMGGCEGCGGGIAAMAGGLRLMLIERVAGLKDVIFE